MIRKSKFQSIYILSVLLILICVFFSGIASVNAWFSLHDPNRVQVEVKVGDVKINVYQNVNSQDVKINPGEGSTSVTTEDQDANDYVVLDGPIAPDTDIPLILKIKNDETGESTAYVRFKFEVYAGGQALDGVTIDGAANFKIADSNGYYYYTADTDSTISKLDSSVSGTMLTSFNIPFDSMVNLTHSELIKIKITVDVSSTAYVV